MLDIVIVILVLFNIAISLHWYTNFYKLAARHERSLESAPKERKDDDFDSQTKSNNADQAVIKRYKIQELSPEIIAPVILKPPRPTGGFGSKVSEQ